MAKTRTPRKKAQGLGDTIEQITEITGIKKLVEFVELDKKVHPYFVSTQAHPEFKSRPTHAHPLFQGLIKAALENKK